MLTQIENRNGIISYDNSLIDQVINESLIAYKGCFKLIKKSFDMKSEGVVVFINLHLKFGTSIEAFSYSVLNAIANSIETNLELPVKSLSILISGIYSKKLVKRNILIEYNNKSEITDNRN